MFPYWEFLIIFAALFKLMDRIFAKSTLRSFLETHPDSEQYLKTWFDTAMSSNWNTPNEVKQTYVNASVLKDSRIVFNIKGNSYRLVAKFNFEKQWIFIRFIGTHIEYDKIDAIRGMNITITTTAKTDEEAKALLAAFSFPFRG